MVAVILLVASVVVIALLTSQTENFGLFVEDRVNSSNCGFAENKYERAIDKQACTEPPAAASIRTQNSGCAWTDNTLPDFYCN
jgi:hypothetical protein